MTQAHEMLHVDGTDFAVLRDEKALAGYRWYVPSEGPVGKVYQEAPPPKLSAVVRELIKAQRRGSGVDSSAA